MNDLEPPCPDRPHREALDELLAAAAGIKKAIQRGGLIVNPQSPSASGTVSRLYEALKKFDAPGSPAPPR